MIRGRWIWDARSRSLVPADEYRREEGKRSDLPSPMLISDHMSSVWHPSDGREYDSKSEFRSVTRKHGGTEVGNDVQTDTRRRGVVTSAEVGEALQKVKQGYRPTVEKTASEGWN